MADPIIFGCGVYAIRCLENDHIYVGSSVDLERRLKDHKRLLNRGKHHSIRLQRAWSQLGEHAFSFELLERVDDASSLLTREQHYIDLLGAFGKHGYNMLPMAGSTRGYRRQPPSEQARENMRKAQIGRKHSEDSKRKISAANKGKKRSPEHCAHMAAIRIGTKLSPETIAKRSAKIRGMKHPPYSAERCRNISEALKGRQSEKAIAVVVDGVTYRSKTEAMQMLKCSFRTLKKRMSESAA